MKIEEVIYYSIWKEFGEDGQILWEDLVRGDSERTPRQALQRAAEVGQKEKVSDYLEKMKLDGYVRGHAVTLDKYTYGTYLGAYAGGMLDLIAVSQEVFSPVTLPKTYAIPAAAKAHLLGFDRVVLCQLNRNTQDWSWFTVTGDFKAAHAYLEMRATPPGLAGKLQPEPKLEIIPNVEIRAQVEKYLWGLNNGEPEPGEKVWAKNVIHPSELSISQCDRAIAYGLLGTQAKEKIDPKLRRIFDVGHIYHDIVQSSLGWHFPGFTPEVQIKNKPLKVFGHCDGVLNHIPRKGVEIKSISFKGFNDLTKAKPEHVKQATIYGACLELESVYYIYVCKENGNIRVYEVPLDRKLWHQIAQQAETIVSTVAKDELPERLENKPRVCEGCKYRHVCRPESQPLNKSRMFSR